MRLHDCAFNLIAAYMAFSLAEYGAGWGWAWYGWSQIAIGAYCVGLITYRRRRVDPLRDQALERLGVSYEEYKASGGKL